MRLPTILFLLVSVSRVWADLAVEVDLGKQKAYVLQDGQKVYESPISSGRESYPTRTGEFKVVEKDIDHRSSLYGTIVDPKGKVLIANADSETPVPAGARFEQAPMRYFLRFDGAIGLHAGYLPGYPASHGCVRMPSSQAALFYHIVQVGTPVRVFGTPPSRPEPKNRRVASAAASVLIPAPGNPKVSWFRWAKRN